jgi:four helix bundle protein
MQDFRSLEVWKKSHQLTLDLYRRTQCFPVDERFGLVSQIRRSAASIACNPAEGAGRGTNLDFARFVDIAIGSACKVDYQLLLAKDLGYISAETHDVLGERVEEIRRKLAGLPRRLRTDN